MKTRMASSDSGRSVDEYDDAIARAGRWLKAQQRPDGSSGDELPLWAYYTQPMAFRAAGDPLSATRCISFTKERFMGRRGALDVNREGIEGITYAPAWTVVNAHMWDRLDISYPVSDWIVRLQDRDTGGVFATPEDAKRKSGLLEYEATMVSGLALLSTGRLDQAENVGRFLFAIHRSQPDIKNQYYFEWDKEKGLITDSIEKKAALFYVVDKHKERQGYFLFGLSIALLSRLYMATGKGEYLKLAKQHFEYVDGCAGTYSTALAHKLCWADALLYQATGDAAYLEAAKKVGDYLLSVQRSDGRYHYKEICPKFEDQNTTANLDIVSQFTTWIAQARGFMAGRVARKRGLQTTIVPALQNA